MVSPCPSCPRLATVLFFQNVDTYRRGCRGSLRRQLGSSPPAGSCARQDFIGGMGALPWSTHWLSVSPAGAAVPPVVTTVDPEPPKGPNGPLRGTVQLTAAVTGRGVAEKGRAEQAPPALPPTPGMEYTVQGLEYASWGQSPIVGTRAHPHPHWAPRLAAPALEARPDPWH